MANLRVIKGKIKAVKNIKKITRALEIVSTVKLQKIKKQTDQFKVFFEEFLAVLYGVSQYVDLFCPEKINLKKKELLIVVSTEKWLCGSMNSKLFKDIYNKYENKKDSVEIFCIGKKAVEYFSRMGFSIVGTNSVVDNFTQKDLTVVNTFVKKAIQEDTYCNITIFFNYFKNSITQFPVWFWAYPLNKESFESFLWQIWIENIRTAPAIKKDLVIEPNPRVYKQLILTQLINYMILAAVLQNKAGEHASRMIAMKNATDNSNTLITTLTLSFNKARQANITQEISEIVSAKIAIEG